MRFILFYSIIFSTLIAQAETGVSDDKIKVGTTTGLTGKSLSLATEFREGIRVGIERINKKGIHGRKIERILLDDGYEPEKAVANVKKLLEEDKVFALVGISSTPVISAILPFAKREKVPVVGPFSGAEFIRTPVEPNVFTFKSGYYDETKRMIDYAHNDLKKKDFAVFYQDDALGTAGTSSTAKYLSAIGMSAKGSATYKRNTVEVEPALDQLMALRPEVVLIYAQSAPALAFVKAAAAKNFHPIFMVASSVPSAEFIENTKTLKHTIFATQVMPPLETASLPIIKSFKEDMKAFAPDVKVTGISFEGYLSMQVFGEALERAGRDLTREKLVKTFEGMSNVDIGGLKYSFSPENHQGLSNVFLTKVENGKIIYMK